MKRRLHTLPSNQRHSLWYNKFQNNVVSQLFSRTDGLTHTLGRAKPQLFLNYTEENTVTYKISLGCFTRSEEKSTKANSSVLLKVEFGASTFPF